MVMTKTELVEYEKAKKKHEATKNRIANLQGKDKRIYEKISKVKMGRYSPLMSEVLCIVDVHQNNAINASYDLLALGFLKGQRAAKADMKKKGNKE